MTVIKAGSDVQVLSYDHRVEPTIRVDQVVSPLAGLESRLERLEAENMDLQGQIERLHVDANDRLELLQKEQAALRIKAFEDGRVAGLGEHHKVIEALRADLSGLVARLKDDFSRVDILALGIVSDCLSQVFGEDNGWIARSAAVISHQLSLISDQSGLNILVSAAEFARDEDFQELCKALNNPKARVERSATLKVGEAEVKLDLGRLEVGAGQQWCRLSNALDQAYLKRVAS